MERRSKEGYVRGGVVDERHGSERRKEVYRRESKLAISSSPVINNNVQFIYRAYCYRVKN